MKYDPVNGVEYDHTPEEWAEAKGGHSGMSLPGSVAAQLIQGQHEQDSDQPSRKPRQRPGHCKEKSNG